MIYTEAQEILKREAHSFGRETVPLEQAFGRVISEKIIADRDYPPFNRSAMDGYALRFEDFEKGERSFTINETIFAGQNPSTKLARNQCYKIMTGASTPQDANLVIRKEDTEEKNGTVTILVDTAKPLQNIAQQGEDLRRDDIIIDKSMTATPAVVSLLAAVGKQSVMVEKLPRVAIVTTGDEVIPVDQAVSDVQIRNSNTWLLRSLLHKQGIQPFSVIHVPDEPAALQRVFKNALDADIIISCGGVSAGDADFVPGTMAALGVEKLFHKLMIRPGKPIWCGKTADGKMVFALPGNPLSCMVTFSLFVQPFLNACYGLPSPTTIPLALQGERNKKTNLDEFFPVKIVPGAAAVQIVPFNGSGDIRAALFADGIARHPREKSVIKEGEAVEYFPILLS
jgi:molybdopterin molybdotransferase